ncbi:MAG: protein tyrosine phosphatase [Alphaproteobacteria bacterium]|nr:protein tyrosine phosphatase [Alphaproteobacteria bacterium]
MRPNATYLRYLFRTACATLTICGLYLLMLQWNGNAHEIIPGTLYRSAQLSPERLADYHAKHGFKTILNLRGANAGAPWYDAERAYAKQAGITLIDFRISTKEQLSKREILRLIATMRDAPKPLLIHCKHGSDRTGLATALYRAAIEGRSEGVAEFQLSPYYGHLPWISAARAMDWTFESIEPMLGYTDS